MSRKETGSGKATVSLRDGMLLEYEYTLTSESSGEFQGRPFNSSYKATTRVERRKSRISDKR